MNLGAAAAARATNSLDPKRLEKGNVYHRSTVAGFFPSLFTIPIYREVSPLFFASSTRKHILGKVNEE